MKNDVDTQADRPNVLSLPLSDDELATIEDFRFENRMPTRLAAIRELLRRGSLRGREAA